MKRKQLWCAAAVLVMAASPLSSHAQNFSPWYLGLKAGWMDADASNFDEATNLGLYGGYTLHDDASGRFALEGEYTRTISDGDIPGGGWDIETLAVYGAYRTAGPWFLKIKAGYLDEDISVSAGGSSIAGSDSGFSFGAGAGVRLSNKAAFELEYTVIEEDVNFFSIGYLTHF